MVRFGVTFGIFTGKMNRQIGFGTRLRISRKPFAALVRQNRRVLGKTLELVYSKNMKER
jgi:hypothetical protein